ncbi:hypothetical protein BDA96_01G465200 [Sorghum bicolor]|uniref:Protein FAR1-RELATED SEQUENCE n=1 Tax=Sorghum bicolor TaxID=4558 RepID=A0A921S5D3_SORBI|nr:hypothetical protein BDA96_01G465200 [Sorghum bicolor]
MLSCLSRASWRAQTTELAVGQSHDGAPAANSEAGTSCRADHSEDVVAGISETKTSSSRCRFSQMATVTADEIATPDAEKKYTHKEDIDPALIPRPRMSFRNREEARKFYSIYAEEVGFGLCYGNNKPYSYIIHCNNEGNNTYFKKKEELRVRDNTSKKTHCMSKMKLKRIYDENKEEIAVVIEYVDLMQNHPCFKKKQETINLSEHKEKDPVFLEFVDDLQAADVPHHSIQNIVRDMHGGGEHVPITKRDLENRQLM